MTQKYLILGLVALALGMTATAEAVNFSVGPKYWYATWENDNFGLQTLEFTSSFQAAGSSFTYTFPAARVKLKETSSTGTGLAGGAFAISGRKWQIVSTALMGEYDLAMKGEYSGIPRENPFGLHESTIDVKTSTDRMDLDLAAGYRIFPNFSVNIGFKHISYKYEEQTILIDSSISSLQNPSFGGVSIRQRVTIAEMNPVFMGPAIGFNGYETLGKTLFTYGSLSVIPYLMGNDDVEELSGEKTGWATNFEFGFGLNFPKAHLQPTVSYRWQRFAGFGDLTDTFSGVTAGLNVTF